MTVVNESGLEPLGHALLCEPYEPELKGTRVVIPDTVREATRSREMRAVVIAVGPDAWPDVTRRAEPGDKVLISKYAGVIVEGPLDGRKYRIVNDEDIFCKITAESWEQVRLSDPIAQVRAERKAVGGRS